MYRKLRVWLHSFKHVIVYVKMNEKKAYTMCVTKWNKKKTPNSYSWGVDDIINIDKIKIINKKIKKSCNYHDKIISIRFISWIDLKFYLDVLILCNEIYEIIWLW